jgi:16S rRNA (uracil1498-N3)-methyltransferase
MPVYFGLRIQPVREIRIYQAGGWQPGESVTLSREAGQHIGVVLRMQAGDCLTLFSGNNREYEARITALHKDRVSVTIEAVNEVNRESPRVIHLAQGISKGDRMETVVQKAVELGVASITPLITERCVVKRDAQRMEKKCLQWQAIAIAACEQSGRNVVPQIAFPRLLDDYVSDDLPGLNFVLYPEAGKRWRDYEFTVPEIRLLIGPEGGLSAQEVHRLLDTGFSPLSLGPRVLRTETAAIAALSILQAVSGDL